MRISLCGAYIMGVGLRKNDCWTDKLSVRLRISPCGAEGIGEGLKIIMYDAEEIGQVG